MEYNKKKLDTIELEYLTKAETLQAELIASGFMASRVHKGEDRTDFHVVFFDGTHDYLIKRDYQNNVYVTRKDYGNYQNVSSSTRGEIYAKYKGDNMKVITAKKLQNKIDAENSYHAEMEAKEAEAVKKVSDFLATLDGLGFKYSKNDSGAVNAGEIVKGGIEYAFTVHQDGYISQKISIYYAVNNTLEDFKKLSDNKYL